MSEEQRRRVISVALRRLRRTRDSRWAWERLYNCFWPFVTSITRRMTRDTAAAEDAAQEVFIRLARYAPFEKLTDPEMFQSYVAATAINTGRDHGRRSRGRNEQPITDEVAGETPDPRATPEQDAEIRDLALRIVSRLTAEEQALLRELVRGTSLQVISAQQDTNYSTIGVRMYRLRRKLWRLVYGSKK